MIHFRCAEPPKANPNKYLDELAPRQAKVVELHYFGGLTEEEIVAALRISPRTVRRDWHFARVWLLRELSHTIGKR